jgi:hypothetical protein
VELFRRGGSDLIVQGSGLKHLVHSSGSQASNVAGQSLDVVDLAGCRRLVVLVLQQGPREDYLGQGRMNLVLILAMIEDPTLPKPPPGPHDVWNASIWSVAYLALFIIAMATIAWISWWGVRARRRASMK